MDPASKIFASNVSMSLKAIETNALFAARSLSSLHKEKE